MPDIFVSGEPVLFLTNKEREQSWRARVLAAVPVPITQPYLAFRVGSFVRGGQPFDIDNLAEIVLDVVAEDPLSVWVTVDVDAFPGVRIANASPPSVQAPVIDMHIAAPPRRSVKAASLPELQDAALLQPETATLGVELCFDSAATKIGQFDFGGPVKPFIDGLGPLFGSYANGPADHRVRELRITKGARPDGFGARLRVWMR